MNFLSKVKLNYTYYYLDPTHQLKTKSLNIIEVLLRKIFGFYPETHSLILSKHAYLATLNPQFHANATEKQSLLKIISKVQDLGVKVIPSPLIEGRLPSGKKFQTFLRYQLLKPQNKEDIFKIKNIKLVFHFEASQFHSIGYIAKIFRDKNKKLIIKFEGGLFNINSNDSINQIKDRYSCERLQLINHVVVKMMKDSTERELFHCGSDYRWVLHSSINSGQFLFKQNPFSQNKIQDQAMSQLGWKCEAAGDLLKRDCKRLYCLSKDEAEKKPSHFRQQLSMDFAFSNLQH